MGEMLTRLIFIICETKLQKAFVRSKNCIFCDRMRGKYHINDKRTFFALSLRSQVYENWLEFEWVDLRQFVVVAPNGYNLHMYLAWGYMLEDMTWLVDVSIFSPATPPVSSWQTICMNRWLKKWPVFFFCPEDCSSVEKQLTLRIYRLYFFIAFWISGHIVYYYISQSIVQALA